MPYSGYPFAAKVGQFKPPNWTNSEYRNHTGESVFQFLASIAQISGIPHEQRAEGLVIFNPVPKAADGVTGTGVSTEAACPASLPPEGDGNPADAPVAGPAPQRFCETPASVEQPSEVTAATPTDAGQAAAIADAGIVAVV